MELGWGGEGGMVGNIGLLVSHLSHLTKSHRPQKDILPKIFASDHVSFEPDIKLQA